MKAAAYLLVLCFIVAAYGCVSDARDQDTPAEVVTAYQHYIDQNDFDSAITLSTPAGASFLRELSALVALQDPDSTVLVTTFEDINCEVEQDTAYCMCNARDQYETYFTEFKLLRIDGQWRVDAPEDDYMLDTDELLQQLMDSLQIE